MKIPSLTSLVSCALFALTVHAQESVKGLAARPGHYFEFATFVISEQQEVIERDGQRYGLLLQNLETKATKPKMKKGNASGFFLYHREKFYYVTARHVARVLNPQSRIGFINPHGDSRGFLLAKLVGSSEKFVWKHHPETDLSIMQLHPSKQGQTELAEISLIADDLFVATPPRTSKLVICGFPGGLGTLGGKISPITSVVHLASDEISINSTLSGIPISSAYLVNPPAGKGFSGGPIFYQTPEGAWKLAGLLNGSWSDPTGGKFSISVPARHLMSMLE